MSTVSVIVPCRNERMHIEVFLRDVQSQQVPEGYVLEVIVADGESDDGTRDVLRAFEKEWPALRVIANPQRIVSTGLNRALRVSTGSVIVRMDAHTRYAPDYIAASIAVLCETSADCVGGPWTPCGTNSVSTAVACVFDSWFVSGGGRAHAPMYEGPADTVYLGCWKREAFERFGFFDETLVRSQDNELNYRIRKAGGMVWQSPRIRARYQARGTIRNLFRQYVQYGYWKVHVLRKHGRPASLRQLAPPGFVALLTGLAAGALWSPVAGLAGAAVLVCYGLASLIAALLACRRRQDWRYLPIVPGVFGAFHLGFGYGFLRGVVDVFLLRGAASASFSALTRASGRGAPARSISLSF